MRYYITDIIGNGTENNPYRPNIPDKPMQKWNIVGEIETNDVGVPVNNFVLVSVQQFINETTETGLGFDAVDAILTNIAYPKDLDSKATVELKTKITNKITKEKINLGNSVTVRDVVREVGKLMSPGFKI